MKYTFATNINGKGLTGVIDVELGSIVCYCSEKQSKLVLEKLNLCEVLTKTISDLNAHISRLGAENEKLMEINAQLRKESI